MHLVATIVVMLLGAVEFVRSAPLDLELEGVDKADAMMVRFLEWFKQAAESAKLNKDLCEDGWMSFGGSCYFFEDSMKVNWNEAKAVSTSSNEQNCRFYADWYLKGAIFTNDNYIPSLPYSLFKSTQQEQCDSREAHLVTIEDRMEDEFLKTFASRLFKTAESRKNVGFYIGATDEAEEGVWRWNNNNNRLSYQGFRKTDQVNEAEDCAILWGGYAFVWGDINCNRVNHFICEKSK